MCMLCTVMLTYSGWSKLHVDIVGELILATNIITINVCSWILFTVHIIRYSINNIVVTCSALILWCSASVTNLNWGPFHLQNAFASWLFTSTGQSTGKSIRSYIALYLSWDHVCTLYQYMVYVLVLWTVSGVSIRFRECTMTVCW